ncbi:hypothetical protein PNK_1678 [Candidatus Protochlamydia naegleriophila]|uniref:Uncharacterized protein n=1 Tax=Candidatus Protochlamydia naegleriophila TaxID=389348 RepID=A0A0U5JDQ7_9BACT|nr:hypothetical protein [Candidatus Protochlamydia naegleriophila]CUI17287.1 hypothetical protein PNK_1678 [Candidatus Protochlamydia naegleriophila]
MSWRSIDFRGLSDLDQKIVDQLEQYLHQKETRLAHQILNSIQPTVLETFSPLLPFGGGHLKLSEAVEGFTKKVRLLVQGGINDIPKDNGERVVKELNEALWEFTEVLEGSVVELFQQIKQVSVDRWHLSISRAVHAIKNMLIHYIEDVMWAIRRLEKPLRDYCARFQPKGGMLQRLGSYWRSYVDPTLLKNLNQSEAFLKQQYEAFDKRYLDYMHISVKVEDALQKMKNYPILALLDVPEQNLYVDVFRLLKALEINHQPKGTLAQETIRSLKHLASIDSVVKVLRVYYRELKDAFFNSSLELKGLDKDPAVFKESLEKLKAKVRDYHYELQQLISTMGHYRTFLLKTDPNPYVRTRWGFSEWVVGPEPVKAKKVLNLIYSGEELSGGYARFFKSLDRDLITQQRHEDQAHQEIEKLLHEMGQPLISRFMMRNRAERLLEQLRECDEIGSARFDTIYYVEEVLSKAMREDWKYHVLHEFPAFHELYRQHQGLSDYIEDPAHAFRMDRFRLLFDQIEEWISKGDIYAHVHEIELDVNDMKTYLQDFLATVQRAVKEKSSDPFLDETIYKFKQELLEYRYLFGQFFFVLLAKDGNGQLRNQFLFVDQYFESIENLLFDLKATWEGKR